MKYDILEPDLLTEGMLDEYEADHHTGMDTAAIAKSIREYTKWISLPGEPDLPVDR